MLQDKEGVASGEGGQGRGQVMKSSQATNITINEGCDNPVCITSSVKTPSLSVDFPCTTCNKKDQIPASSVFGSVAFDPRNGLMEPHFGLPLQFPSAFATAFHTPIPVDQRTHEGRYVWDQAAAVRIHPFHHPSTHGMLVVASFNTPLKRNELAIECMTR
uniref:Uncharacterized protein n=1 Tax=Strigamia maritima TaxID=126957 RepID=T1JMX1_STRMM